MAVDTLPVAQLLQSGLPSTPALSESGQQTAPRLAGQQQPSPTTTASSFPQGVDPSLAMAGQQMQANQPPAPMPIALTLAKGLHDPSSVGAGSRSQVFENFLGNFIG